MEVGKMNYCLRLGKLDPNRAKVDKTFLEVFKKNTFMVAQDDAGARLSAAATQRRMPRPGSRALGNMVVRLQAAQIRPGPAPPPRASPSPAAPPQ